MSLSDFSRVLKRLYSKMEMAAPRDNCALRHLRDGELSGESFDVMRQEALTLFQETEQSQLPARTTRAREAQVDSTKDTKPDQVSLIDDLLAGQKSLVEALGRLSGELVTMQSTLPSPRRPLSEIVCYKFNNKGHVASNCYSQQGDSRLGSN